LAGKERPRLSKEVASPMLPCTPYKDGVWASISASDGRRGIAAYKHDMPVLVERSRYTVKYVVERTASDKDRACSLVRPMSTQIRLCKALNLRMLRLYKEGLLVIVLR
jgi:hypothetical protein